MTLQIGLITFVADTMIKAEDINSNFNNINTAGALVVNINGTAGSANNATLAGQIQDSNGITYLTTTSGGVLTATNDGSLTDYHTAPFRAWSNFGGTGSGTYNHGWKNQQVPNFFYIWGYNSSTDGWSVQTITDTSVNVTLNISTQFFASCSYMQ